MNIHDRIPFVIPACGDCQPIPEPPKPLNHVVCFKPEWVVDCHWPEEKSGLHFHGESWIPHGECTTEPQARQAAEDMSKFKHAFGDRHRIRNVRTWEKIEL